jgi:hypothetical protein
MSIMSGQESKKLKSLLGSVPAGFLVDSVWLEKTGIGRRSSYAYVKRGWLERLARGVFRRPVPDISQSNSTDWKSAVLSLQHIMDYPIHVGGMTALALQGYRHYLPLGGNVPLWLYGADIPSWLERLELDARLETRKTTLFADAMLGLTDETNNRTQSSRASLPWNWSLRMSAPERAILEALDELPMHESFHNVDMVFEGLTTLRPKLVSALLTSCKKIKVRRLFFIFADRHSHPWRKHLDPEEFDLGSGDRALVKGGKIHPRYRIMVPEPFTSLRTEDNDGS